VVPEPRVVTTKEQPTKRIRQAVSKRPRASASQGEPSLKKAKKGSEVKTLTQMPEVIPPSAEEQEGEEEEEEEEAVPTLHSQGLRSRGPAILAEGEPAGESTMTEGAEGLEEAVEGLEVDIPEVSTWPGTSSTHERRKEVQQPGSPSVLMSTWRVVEPNPTTGVLSGKAPTTKTSWVQFSSLSSEKHEY